jgi:ketosteroid isomerase-like protein
VACATVSAAHGQQASTSALQSADRAFADALIHHDRAAFVAMFAPDAESTLPVLKRGPEAIADAWLPFLIDPGTTMIFTNVDVTAEESGDTGTSLGTFAIEGRTQGGVKTIPVGKYTIAWRVIDGHWRISRLAGSRDDVRKTAERGGVGPFRFGMTREEVSSVTDCEPYTAVRVTGGLECPHYRFDGREMNISFLFTGDRLSRIQLWYYEGASNEEAREAVGRVLDFLERTTGAVTVQSMPNQQVTASSVMSTIERTVPKPGQLVQLEICARARTPSEVWFSRVGRHQYGYGVMLFAVPATAQ